MNEINLLFQRKQIGIVGNGRFGALKQKLEFLAAEKPSATVKNERQKIH